MKAAVGLVTLERLAWRQESAARVQWQRGIGAHIAVTGARMSIPILGSPTVEPKKIAGVAADPSLIPLPYLPGQEPLWVGQFAARPDVNENSMINPLANGAEAYYTYKAGGETTIKLYDGEALVVRQPAKSVGLGFSFFDGVLCFDVARGIFPVKQTRVSFYLGSRY